MHKQFTESKRCVLAELLRLGLPKSEIARRLGVDRSSVYREIRRNSGGGDYEPTVAHGLATTRRWYNCRPRRKLDDPETQSYVCRCLKKEWSPDQIAGRARLDFPRRKRQHLSRQTIYNWINRQPPEERTRWRECLRFGKPRRKRTENAGRLPGAVSIEGRPKIVASRRRFGDWEGDTIVGAGRRGGLLSLVERKSGYTMLARVGDLCAATVRQAAEQRLLELPEHLRRSLTFDNGKEFAEHEALSSATGMGIYFAKPYCAWQRGTNENTNGLVRQYFPKGSDLAAKRRRVVASAETKLNDRPRRRHGYRTPHEVLTENCARHGVAFGN